ncbi:hypothetical protein BpHYR1_001843 [Brachionus plicatilis]|uniref:Uncharacterized protein n=1 Tax=Brachionus plicatilis TaxID=10195 RepID=A0A3M7QUY1_BRAPC|nr:hypothetical protein BpHYR1_001843 [Brachionus plicatilis]
MNREAELYMRVTRQGLMEEKYEISYGNTFINVCINLNFRHHQLFFTALSDFLRHAYIEQGSMYDLSQNQRQRQKVELIVQIIHQIKKLELKAEMKFKMFQLEEEIK